MITAGKISSRSQGGLRRMRQDAQAALLLFDNLSPGSRLDRPAHTEDTNTGIRYDLYEPEGTVLGIVILVYGFTLMGEKDARLVKFGKACAAAGLRTVVPTLPGIKSFQFDERDLGILTDLSNDLKQHSAGSIGVVGFSTGGSYALLTAADQEAADQLDPLILFSPYYTLADLLANQIMQPLEQPQTERDWEHFIWAQLVLAYRNLERLKLSTDNCHELVDFLGDYCVESMPRKYEIYERLLKDLDIPGLDTFQMESPKLERFSLCGKLGAIQSRVMILHDPNDYLIPPEHSQKIIDELNTRVQPVRARLLVTPLISHVSPRYHLRLKDMLTVIDMVGELFPR